MANPILRCPQSPEKGCDLKFISKQQTSALKYDYTETSVFYYYKCEKCNKMFDEKVLTTGIRPLALRHYEKVSTLANN